MLAKSPALRGIRGAITVSKNSRKEILEGTRILLKKVLQENKIHIENIVSVIFSTTRDLNAEFPAVAARQIGMDFTPLLCTHEMNVPQGLKKCIRILLHVNTNKSQRAMKNVYLRGAEALRPDLPERSLGLFYVTDKKSTKKGKRKR